VYKTDMKAWLTDPLHNFAPNTSVHYVLRHCLNIVFMLQKITIIRKTHRLNISSGKHLKVILKMIYPLVV